MKKTTNINIHDLDTLEKEIYRLKLKAKNIEIILDDNFEKLRHNYSSMFMNSFFQKTKNEKTNGNGFFESIFNNETVNAGVNKITDHISDKAIEGIGRLIDKVFKKKEK